ncbi:hypothetical protein Noda2021_01230 [Candidatus Dependentiae bacterium Noda2021]|nr:hypothetical protein Noda2021_01230 [Candidatus Dependentiae bacterium Noda2021]
MKLYRLIIAIITVALIPHELFSTTKSFDFDDPEIAALLEQEPDFSVTRQSDKADIINILLSVGAIDLLKEPFFLRSNKLNTRSLLDYPLFIRFKPCKRAFGMDLFYNATARKFFDKNSSNISSYLAVTGDSFITALENVFTRLGDLIGDFDAEFFSTLPLLFETFTVEERRLGLMFYGNKDIDKYRISVLIPWYYLERNYFVNQEEQDLIEETIADAQKRLNGQAPSPQSVCNDAVEQFQDLHLISDKFGIGDSRIMVDMPWFNRRDWELRIGTYLTIPSAFCMTKGLKGTNFKPPVIRPSLNLLDLINQALNEGDFTEGEFYNFLLGSLDNLGAMVLEEPIGNGGHLGIAVYSKSVTPLRNWINLWWTRHFTWNSFMSIEYLLPKQEQRFFISCNDENEFDTRDFESEAQANDNFDFLTRKLTERFYPFAYYATVHPGFIFRSTSNFCYERKKGGFAFGTDTYVKLAERLYNIKKCDALATPLNRKVANKPLVYQSKIYGSFFWKVKQLNRSWVLSLNVDSTWSTSGIGPDYMATFKCDVCF